MHNDIIEVGLNIEVVSTEIFSVCFLGCLCSFWDLYIGQVNGNVSQSIFMVRLETVVHPAYFFLHNYETTATHVCLIFYVVTALVLLLIRDLIDVYFACTSQLELL